MFKDEVETKKNTCTDTVEKGGVIDNENPDELLGVTHLRKNNSVQVTENISHKYIYIPLNKPKENF